ncbi:MAG TPA: STAS domain-containing protein [Solirubrobacteraceae bacterium]|jgi:anti-anti-sigma factor
MHAPLKLRETPGPADFRKLSVGGELDLGTAAQLRVAIGTLMGTGCRHLVVDLAETTFMDSSGLAALVWAAHRMHAAGGELTVAHPTEQIRKVLEITGVGDLLLAPER